MTAASKTTLSPARREAFRILLEVGRSGAHSDELLRSNPVSALAAADRGLCTALVLGVLRWQIRLDAVVRPLLARPNARLEAEVQVALRMGAYQHLFLDRIPAHAAIGESVALCKAAGHKFASGMVNAVLRKVAAMPKASALEMPRTDGSRVLAEASAHPAWLVERWVRFYGMDAARELCRRGQAEPKLALRLTATEVEGKLAERGIELGPGALLTSARTVVRGDLAGSVLLADDALRIQDEGSQLIGELAAAAVDAPRRILDCCAAPGGKTLILAERHPEARVTALELHPGRCEGLRRRMRVAGESDPGRFGRIEVRQGDAAGLALGGKERWDEGVGVPGGVDLILVDAPCSGTGTLGRNPEIRNRLEPADLVRHHERQCAILSSVLGYAAERAAPGGMVRALYSTCSLEPEENHEVIDKVLRQVGGWRRVSLAACVERLAEMGRITAAGRELLTRSFTVDGELMLLPGAPVSGSERGLDTDGFFAALIERAP